MPREGCNSAEEEQLVYRFKRWDRFWSIEINIAADVSGNQLQTQTCIECLFDMLRLEYVSEIIQYAMRYCN